MDREKQKERARRRRNDKERRKRAKKNQLLTTWTDYGFESKEAFVRWVEEKANRECDLRTPCSCWMCGNPRRKYNEVTLKEKIFDDIQKDSLDNLDEDLGV
jgi:hypothetical protein